jgi:hypothetical protein
VVGSPPEKKIFGRHITALEKFEFENHLRLVVTGLVEPIYAKLEDQKSFSAKILFDQEKLRRENGDNLKLLQEVEAKLCEIDSLRKIIDEDRAQTINIQLNGDRKIF